MSDANEEEQLSTVEQIVRELKSEYGDSNSCVAPYKYLFAPSLTNTQTDLSRNWISGTITLTSEHQSPYGDNWRTDRNFDVTRADIDTLTSIAPKFQACFSRISDEMEKKLDADREASRQSVESWSKAGLPTDRNIGVHKPLRLRRG